MAVIAAAEQVDVVGDQALGLGEPWGLGRQLAQLQLQAFAKVARTDTRGLELLDAVQDGFDFVQFDVQFRVEGLKNLFECLVQIALVIDAIDQGRRRSGDRCRDIGARFSCHNKWLCRLSPADVRVVKSHSSSSLLGRLLALVW